MRAACSRSIEMPAFPHRPEPAVPGRGDRTGRGDSGPGRAPDHPGRRRRPLVGSGRRDRGPRPPARRTGRHHAQRQGLARRATPAFAGPCPLEPRPACVAACRRHARGRLPVHRGHDRLAADAGSRDAHPDRPRPRANRHELPGDRGNRRRRQGRARRLGLGRRRRRASATAGANCGKKHARPARPGRNG